jgi:RNA polymerase sigma-32 factor
MSRPSNVSSTLDQYMREIREVPLLTVDEERQLARRFREEGDPRAGHRLVEANLRFVVKVAFEYRRYGLPVTDLIQEGNMGLMKAVQRFDPGRGIRLISYAVWWMRAYIQNHILKSWSLVKIGTTQAQRRLFFSLARTHQEIERLTPGAGLSGEGIDVARVAEKLRVRPGEVVEMTQRVEGRDLSLDAPVRGGPGTHLEFTRTEGEGQDEELARAEGDALLSRWVAGAMARLDARERQILEARIMGDGKESLRELGEQLGFSRERARQLQARALEKVRRELAPVAREIGWPTGREHADAG